MTSPVDLLERALRETETVVAYVKSLEREVDSLLEKQKALVEGIEAALLYLPEYTEGEWPGGRPLNSTYDRAVEAAWRLRDALAQVVKERS